VRDEKTHASVRQSRKKPEFKGKEAKKAKSYRKINEESIIMSEILTIPQ
jgi:hypothetical protein